jgi:hypothetical protein
LLSQLFLPRFLDIYPLQSDYPFLCALSSAPYGFFPHGLSCTYDFDPSLFFLIFFCVSFLLLRFLTAYGG